MPLVTLKRELLINLARFGLAWLSSAGSSLDSLSILFVISHRRQLLPVRCHRRRAAGADAMLMLMLMLIPNCVSVHIKD